MKKLKLKIKQNSEHYRIIINNRNTIIWAFTDLEKKVNDFADLVTKTQVFYGQWVSYCAHGDDSLDSPQAVDFAAKIRLAFNEVFGAGMFDAIFGSRHPFENEGDDFLMVAVYNKLATAVYKIWGKSFLNA